MDQRLVDECGDRCAGEVYRGETYEGRQGMVCDETMDDRDEVHASFANAMIYAMTCPAFGIVTDSELSAKR